MVFCDASGFTALTEALAKQPHGVPSVVGSGPVGQKEVKIKQPKDKQNERTWWKLKVWSVGLYVCYLFVCLRNC